MNKTFRHVRLVTRKDKRSRVWMEETIWKDNILISRKKAAQERRLQEKREKRELPTRPSRTRRELKRDQERDQMKKKRRSIRDSVQAKRALIREQTRERVRKYRERQTQENNVEEILGGGAAFPNRTSKKRATDKVKTTLPASPAKKAAVLESLVSGPRTRKQLEKRGVVTTPEEQREVAKLKALASDISSGLAKVIKKSRAKRSLGKLVNLNEKNISKAIKLRESILKGDTPSWLYTKRKVRQDAISEEDAKKVFNYWAHTASRPTGDKKDVLKQHIGKEEHVKHTKHVLQKTQTDAFREFLELHSEVKIRQRKFESLKPFFVKQAKEHDRRSCLCRKHVEMQIVFKSCMKYRKELVKKSANIDESFVIKSVTEAAEKPFVRSQKALTITTSNA